MPGLSRNVRIFVKVTLARREVRVLQSLKRLGADQVSVIPELRKVAARFPEERLPLLLHLPGVERISIAVAGPHYEQETFLEELQGAAWPHLLRVAARVLRQHVEGSSDAGPRSEAAAEAEAEAEGEADFILSLRGKRVDPELLQRVRRCLAEQRVPMSSARPAFVLPLTLSSSSSSSSSSSNIDSNINSNITSNSRTGCSIVSKKDRSGDASAEVFLPATATTATATARQSEPLLQASSCTVAAIPIMERRREAFPFHKQNQNHQTHQTHRHHPGHDSLTSSSSLSSPSSSSSSSSSSSALSSISSSTSRLSRFSPSSVPHRGLHPSVAWLLCEVAAPRAGEEVLDPCCGVGGLLLEVSQLLRSAGQQEGAAGAEEKCLTTSSSRRGRLRGLDCDGEAVAKARENMRAASMAAAMSAVSRRANGGRGRSRTLAATAPTTTTTTTTPFLRPSDVQEADARAMPLPDSCIDVVLSDLPQGRKYGTFESARSLYPRLCQEIARVLRPPAGRAVLLAGQDCCEDLAEALASASASSEGLSVTHRLTFHFGQTSEAHETHGGTHDHDHDGDADGDADGDEEAAEEHGEGETAKRRDGFAASDDNETDTSTTHDADDHGGSSSRALAAKSSVESSSSSSSSSSEQQQQQRNPLLQHNCVLFCVTKVTSSSSSKTSEARFNLDPGGNSSGGGGGGGGGHGHHLHWNSSSVNTREDILERWRRAHPPLKLLLPQLRRPPPMQSPTSDA